MVSGGWISWNYNQLSQAKARAETEFGNKAYESYQVILLESEIVFTQTKLPKGTLNAQNFPKISKSKKKAICWKI